MSTASAAPVKIHIERHAHTRTRIAIKLSCACDIGRNHTYKKARQLAFVANDRLIRA